MNVVIKISIKISYLSLGKFVFVESLGRKEEPEEKAVYTVPQTTSPVSKMIWLY